MSKNYRENYHLMAKWHIGGTRNKFFMKTKIWFRIFKKSRKS